MVLDGIEQLQYVDYTTLVDMIERYLWQSNDLCDINSSHSSRPLLIERAKNLKELGTHLRSTKSIVDRSQSVLVSMEDELRELDDRIVELTAEQGFELKGQNKTFFI